MLKYNYDLLEAEHKKAIDLLYDLPNVKRSLEYDVIEYLYEVVTVRDSEVLAEHDENNRFFAESDMLTLEYAESSVRYFKIVDIITILAERV